MQSESNSPGETATTATSPNPSGRKRKASAAGSRGVATLTPEQLAKKRANDREAQRAIRERTKQTIQKLERRIQDLTSQQPYQELQAVIRQKDALQAENDEIRRRLASILSIIQPVIGAQGLTDLATAAQNNVTAALGGQTSTFNQDSTFLNSASPILSTNQNKPTTYLPHFAPEEVQTENRTWHTSRDTLDQTRDTLPRVHDLNDRGDRLSFNFLLDNLGQKSVQLPPLSLQTQSPDSRGSYPAVNNGFSDEFQAPWAILPKHTPPTCPLDAILLNFLRSRQEDAQSGSSRVSEPPAYPSVASILNPTAAYQVDALSQLMVDIISKFPNISGLPDQAATLFCMFMFMRWLISPTQENYERIPEWMKPRPSQLYTPHPAWIDHLPWPRMRDRVVANYTEYPFDNWFIPFTSDLSVNWPYDDSDCFLTSPEGGEVLINPVFERHIRRLENWSLGPAFAEAYPGLVDTTTIKRNEPRRSSMPVV